MTRLPAVVAVLVLGAVAALLPASSATAIGEPLTVKITCDPATGGVKTSVLGYVPGPLSLKPVTVSFQRSAYTVTPRGLVSVPLFTPPYEVRTLTSKFSTIAVKGYAYANDPTALYHWERSTATVKDTAGNYIASASTICRHDTRTVVTITCDREAETVTAVVSGRGDTISSSMTMGIPASVVYTNETFYQYSADQPGFIGTINNEFTRRVTRNADGSWADTGYIRELPRSYYRYSERTSAVVYDVHGHEVGRGTAYCAMA